MNENDEGPMVRIVAYAIVAAKLLPLVVSAAAGLLAIFLR